MISIFTSDSSQFKFDVLVEVAREALNNDLSEEKANAMARQLVSLGGERFRCCVYKEREVLRQRVRLAMGKMANDSEEYKPKQIVQVIEAACDGCTIQKIQVTDNCRKCMKKSCMAACNFGAISMGPHRSQIDHTKCKECGACARACPYNAIVVTERPCFASCPVQAISWNEANIAQIDEDRCINCGACLKACPFGAISDMSWVSQVIKMLKTGVEAYAIVAPSIQGQFENVPLPQIMKAVEMLGFTKCLEVASGADAVAYYEAEELVKHKETGLPMTTSCCPGFVNMLKIHFPEQYEKNKSTTVTPMMATARKLKLEHPGCKVVFVGPCVAKKQEACSETCLEIITGEGIQQCSYKSSHYVSSDKARKGKQCILIYIRISELKRYDSTWMESLLDSITCKGEHGTNPYDFNATSCRSCTTSDKEEKHKNCLRELRPEIVVICSKSSCCYD